MTASNYSSIQYFPASGHKSMPWKNGGGTTVEIFSYPQGSTINNFEWRLSMARVDVDGPFSKFSKIERTLSVLDGEGMILDIEGFETPQRLSPETKPLFFAADTPTFARLKDGPITDLNIMTHSKKWAHKVQRSDISTPQELDTSSNVTIIFVQAGGVSVQADQTYYMHRNDSLIISDYQDTVSLFAENTVTAIIITLTEKTES